MTSWCMSEHCMFLTVVILPLFSVSRMCCGTVCGVGPCVLLLGQGEWCRCKPIPMCRMKNATNLITCG